MAGRSDGRADLVAVVRRAAGAGDGQRLWSRLYNGDTGVTVLATGCCGRRSRTGEPLEFATSRLADVDTMHAMTIHKSQGSQADEVTVLLPPEDSRLLTRELFYTAVTRAKEKIRVVGPEASVRAAVDRRAVRASGLGRRLAGIDA